MVDSKISYDKKMADSALISTKFHVQVFIRHFIGIPSAINNPSANEFYDHFCQ